MSGVTSLLVVLTVLSRFLAYASVTVLIAVALATVVDVVLRYVFNAPLFGLQDAAELGLLAVVFLAMPYCGLTGGHVAIDILVERLGAGLRLGALFFARLVGIMVFGILAWRAALAAQQAERFDAASNLLLIPHAPFFWLIAACAALYAIIQIVETAILLARGDANPSRPTGS